MTDTETVAPEAPTPRLPCLCGCGETPKGKKARFMPGHDAQFKASLYRSIRAEDTPEGEKTAAVAKLDEMGWPQPAPKKPRAPRNKGKNGDTETPAEGEVTTADV